MTNGYGRVWPRGIWGVRGWVWRAWRGYLNLVDSQPGSCDVAGVRKGLVPAPPQGGLNQVRSTVLHSLPGGQNSHDGAHSSHRQSLLMPLQQNSATVV